ncbi:MAG: DUF2802 domain-containing protein, partial [Holosporales bacterium]|nr:DUF2802 domain-containing protein [Holosporales bacterium]
KEDDPIAKETIRKIEDAKYNYYSELATAKDEGKAEGREEGREEGEAKAKRETAIKLLSRGMSIEDIIDITGLSREEIDLLRK